MSAEGRAGAAAGDVRRVLLTGWTGQVGLALARALPAGYALYRTEDGTGHRLDLLDPAAVRGFVRRIRPHVIINAAAYTAVDKAETERDAARALNADLPAVLAAEAEALQGVLVHYSTDYVFPGSGTRPWREEDLTGPLNHYGETKLLGERAAAACARHLIFRTSWVYGPDRANFMKTMLKLGADREELRVVADQTGAPTTADFLARWTWRALARVFDPLRPANRTWDGWGLYHLCCAGETTWHGFAEAIFAEVRRQRPGLPLKVARVTPIGTADYPVPAKRPGNSRLDCGRFARVFDAGLEDWRQELTAAVAAWLSQNT